ncbi:HypC/HybG/HupF family hydrogenase formation chaperone [Ammoniphilus resinae]|uniref:Hydrogenase expression/formation protein HypC n=1 Tax=Ammoniphilus resinae TaxID=861532 RepID=A0ABS4GML0_9BACL|nr:HypC/HybG/HupF family hydrogenase formation chaperone [Ammoniphilus resinae]MBP1931105.1 hydrogenase expression/formation protein HypC [Ammoniphilus resinae]
MCLSVPAKIIEIGSSGWQAKVDYLGSHIDVGISLLDRVEVGQYVLVHVGEAIQVVDEELAKESIEIWKGWLDEA